MRGAPLSRRRLIYPRMQLSERFKCFETLENLIERTDEHGLKYSLMLDKSEYRVGEPVKFQYIVENLNDYRIDFSFNDRLPDGTQTNYEVFRDGGRVYLDWNTSMLMMDGFEIGPQDKRTIEKQWDQIEGSERRGEPSGVGDYVIRVYLNLNSELIIFKPNEDPGRAYPNTSISLPFKIIDSIGVEEKMPAEFSLQQNYPNPFNAATTIQYTLNERCNVILKVYDIRGALVRTLVNQVITPGIHSVDWDGIDSNGNKVSSGVYIYKIQTGGFSKTNKMLLIR